MSSASIMEFGCKIYEQRPTACRSYPWSDPKMVFPSCVFVEDGQVVDFDTAVRHLGSRALVEEACRQCGRCCYGWRQERETMVPLVQCSHLLHRVRPSARPPAAPHPDHARMAAVCETQPFTAQPHGPVCAQP